jgi:hypothetical protein
MGWICFQGLTVTISVLCSNASPGNSQVFGVIWDENIDEFFVEILER